MIRVRVEPQVGTREAQRGVGLREADVETHVADRRAHGLHRVDRAARRVGGREEALEGVRRARVADHDGRAQLALVGHAHADRAPTLHEDLSHVCVDEDLAALALDERRDAARDGGRAADGEVRAPDVVRGHGRVHREARLPGRQPVVAPLRREHGLQVAVRRERAQHLRRGARRVAKERRTQERSENPRHGARQGAIEHEGGPRARRGFHEAHVVLDRALLAGEVVLHALDEALGPGHVVEGAVAEVDAIVDVRERRPVERAVGEPVEEGPHGALRPDLPDVVHADVPLVARPREGVREAARGVVALEHEHSLFSVLCEHGGGGESADAGADHDGVVGPRGALLLVGEADVHLHPRRSTRSCHASSS